ncbi:hypothetical protein PIB30_028001 [Stylosanthes scabra]|uniref:Uncharacterized protein n=1 Tax=Stylosanthes scabra TaxID=79078 RepID=A0ABU6X8F4_9FABA|nr:hypothetical protein [Stylosanthes scabra]
MGSCVSLLPAPDVTRNKSEYGFFNQRSASWQCHLIPHLLNADGTTTSYPTLRRTDQAGRTTILIRRNTLLTFFRCREETTSHTYLGNDPYHQAIQGMQARHNLRPCSKCFLASFVTGSLDRRLVQPWTRSDQQPFISSWVITA